MLSARAKDLNHSVRCLSSPTGRCASLSEIHNLVIVLAVAIQTSGISMIELGFAVHFTLSVNVAHLVQVAVLNAAAIKDLAAALYYIAMASYFFRKTLKLKK